MKGKYISFVLGALMLMCVGCEDEVKYRIDENLPLEEYTPLDDITAQMNSFILGNLVCDEENIYFSSFEEGFVRLYKKQYSSDKLTLLAERPLAESPHTEVLFSNFYLKGEYLYFILFDGNTPIDTPQDMRNVLCRVRVDGTESFERVFKPEEYVESICMLGDKLYFSSLKDFGFELQQYDLERGEKTVMFSRDDEDKTDQRKVYYEFDFILGDYVYYNEFDYDYCTLHRCRFDGSDDEQLVKLKADSGELVFKTIPHKDKLYICNLVGEKLYTADLDGKNCELLLENVPIVKMNMDKDKILFNLRTNDIYKAGIYEYRVGYKMLLPLYKGGDIVFGPMIDGFGRIWATLPSEESRFGQLHQLDVRTQSWSAVK